MSLLSKLFGGKAQPPKRVRICIECGMPLDSHKEWCSILRTRIALEQRQAAATAEK